MEAKDNIYSTKYQNGASVAAIYHSRPHSKFHNADRIELKFHPAAHKPLDVRMTFSEAITVIKLLSMACDAFLVDRANNPDFDTPLEALV